MAQNNDNIKLAYDLLTKEGYTDLGTEDEFRASMDDTANRRLVYDALKEAKYTDIGDSYDAWDRILGYGEPKAQQPAQAPSTPVQPTQPTQPTQVSTPTPQDSSQFMISPEQFDSLEKAKENIYGVDSYQQGVDQERSLDAAAKERAKEMKEAFETNGGREKLEQVEQQADEVLGKNPGVQLGRWMQAPGKILGEGAGQMGLFGVPVLTGLTMGGKALEKVSALFSEETRDAATAKRKVEEAKEILREAEHIDENWADRQLGGVWRGTMNTLLDTHTWDFGLQDATQAFNAKATVEKAMALQEKINRGEDISPEERLTPSEQLTMDALMLSSIVNAGYQDDLSMGYQAGKVAGYSAGFAASLALNPASGLGQGLQAGAKATSIAAVRELVKRYGLNGAAKLMKLSAPFRGSKAGSILARGLGDLAEAGVATTTTQLPRWMEDYAERRAGQTQAYYDEYGTLQYAGQQYDTDGNGERDTPFESLMKSFGATYIENASEMVGEWLPFGRIKPLKDVERGTMRFGIKEGKRGVEKLTLHPEDFGPGEWSQAVRALRQRAHFGGLASEYLEEVIGNFANAITVGDMNFNGWDDPNSVFNPEQNLLTFLGVAVGVGQTKALESWAPAAVRSAANYYTDREFNKAYQTLKAAYGEDFGELESTITQLREGTVENAAASLREALRPENVKTVKRAQALLDFAKQVKISQGVTTMLAKMEEQNTEEGMARAAFFGGMSAPKDKWYDAAREYEIAEEAAQATFGEAYPQLALAIHDNTPAGMRAQFFNGLDEKQREVAAALYYNRRRIDGIVAQSQNEGEDAVEPIKRNAWLAAGDDGTVITAEYKGKPVFVATNTGNSALIIDQQTGKRTFVPTSSISGTQVSQLRDFVTQAEEAAMNASYEQADRLTSHHMNTEAPRKGLIIQVRNGDGTVSAIGLTGQLDDGTWTAVPAEGEEQGGWVLKATDNPRALTEDEVMQMQDDWYNGVVAAPTGETQEGEAPAEGVPAEGAPAEVTETQPAETPAPVEAPAEVPAPAEAPIAQQPQQPQAAEPAASEVPLTEEGEVDFSQMEPQAALDYLTQAYQDDEEDEAVVSDDIDAAIAANQAEAQKAKDKVKKPKVTGKPIKDAAARKERKAQLAEAQKLVDFWNAVADLRKRQTSRDLIKEGEKNSPEMQQMLKAAEGNRGAMERLNQREPETLDELIASLLSRSGGVKLQRNDEEVDGTLYKGIKANTGWSDRDIQKFNFLLASREKGGITIDAFADLVREYANNLGIRYEDETGMEVFNAILDFLQSVDGEKAVNNYIQNRRIDEVKEMLLRDEEARLEYEAQQAAGQPSQPVTVAQGEMPFAPSAEEQEAAAEGVAEEAAGREAARQEGENARKEGESEQKKNFIDAIKDLYSKGKEYASKLYQRTFFDVANTPDFMKSLGLTGDKFTVRYGVLSRHIGKDAEHALPVEVWEQLPEALQHPFAITRYYEDDEKKKQKGYRLYTAIRLPNGSYVVVSAEVKNAGKELEVNAINTVFGRDALSAIHDELIYTSPQITPEQQALLDGNNPHQYPAGRELSEGKGSESSDTKQENGEKINEDSQNDGEKINEDSQNDGEIRGEEQHVGDNEEKSSVVDEEDIAEWEQLKKEWHNVLREERSKMGAGPTFIFNPDFWRVGTRMAFLVVKHGAYKFADYARTMIGEMGDVIRPYLKTFYNGARDMAELAGEKFASKMTPYQEVNEFDVANFDKTVPDVMDYANEKAAENDVDKNVNAILEAQKPETEKRDSYNAGEKVVLDEDGKVYTVDYTTQEGEVIPGQPNSYVVYYHLAEKPYKKYTVDQLSGIKKPAVSTENGAESVKDGQKTKPSKKNNVSLPQEPDLFSQASETEAQPEGKSSTSDNLKQKLTEEQQKKQAFSQSVADDMLEAMMTGEKPYKSIKDIREKARTMGLYVDDEGRTDIELLELVENGLVIAARNVVTSGRYGGRKSKDALKAIIRLYELQPTIAARSSERVRLQQYSTPLPMSFVADMWQKGGAKSILEPTAGNGMLVFAIPANVVHANEIDDTRRANLESQGFAEVTGQDATQPFPGGKQYDGIIMNPPFGSAEAKEFDGVEISGLDPQIVINSLESMKDDGRAAIIIGGNMEYSPNGAIKNKRDFFCYLYDHYNVVGVVDMAGDLYARQGTKYPTRMILINGRRSEEERAQTTVYPPTQSQAPAMATSFEELYDIVLGLRNSNKKTNGNEILRTEDLPLADNGTGEGNNGRESDTGQHRPNDSNERGRTGREGSTGGPRRDGRNAGVERSDGSSRVGSQRPEDAGLFDSTRPDGSQTISDNEGAGDGKRGGRREGDVGTSGRNGLENLQGSRAGQQRVGLTPERVEKKRELTDEKLPYRAHSGAFSLESVAPASMVEAMDAVLKKIEAEYGPVDEFVREELGYDTIDAAYKALAAEQVDAVAMAIYQMKKGQALIIGDQTGVGKGRQMAALIRWAVKQGKKPIFITQKADLFTDIYRDLIDVGSGDLRPFIFNADGVMLDDDENVVHSALNGNAQKRVMQTGELPDGYDFAVLTYSQVNSGDNISREEARKAAKASGKRAKKKEDTPKEDSLKAKFLRAIAKNNYLFLDESHTAAGESNTGYYLQSLLKDAAGVSFASATFAKRPDTMPLYALRTAMSKAKVGAGELIGIIQKGGVTLQEIMSRALTEAGQMVRRERNMDGVKTDWKTVDDPETVMRAREHYDRTIEAFNAIIDFQNTWVKPYIKELSDQRAVTASSAGVKQGTNDMGIANVPFASKAYNYTKQLMLALKVDAIVDEVEKEIKAGRHPVIALESTMESTTNSKKKSDNEEDEVPDFNAGTVLSNPSFAMSLQRGLDTVMQYTITEGKKKTHFPIRPSELGPAGEQAYYDLVEFIRQATEGIYVSPLDAIIEKLRARGYSVGELTGRNTYVERQPNGTAVVKKMYREGGKKKWKKIVQNNFNNGTTDVLILNKSASTGISLHASERFSDQRQRSMVIAQPLSDINDYMQMIGRIDRTGQVHRGYYINLGLPVPAEQRFLMMLSTKLKSLNANTTTSQDSETNDVEAPDLLNKYGSKVIVEYLRDNPGVYEMMGEPLFRSKERVKSSELGEYTASPDDSDARRITGYVALLPTALQEDFYSDVVQRYTDLIRYLDEVGENDLKIKVMPLRAETVSKEVSSEGVDPTGENPFARDAYVERVMMDVLRKPMKASEIQKLIDNLNAETGKERRKVEFPTAAQEKAFSATPRIEEIASTIYSEAEAKLDAENERHEKALSRIEEDITKYNEKIRKNEKMSDDEKQASMTKYAEEKRLDEENRHRVNTTKIRFSRDSMLKQIKRFKVGETYLIPDNLELATFDFFSPGIFCGFKAKDSGITPSTTFAVFATLDGRRKIEIKLSQGDLLEKIEYNTLQNYDSARLTTLENWDSQIPSGTRKEGFILTGNILQAINDAQFRGQLISYTDLEGNVHDGLLMPDKWTTKELKGSGVPINSRYADIRNGRVLKSIDGNVVVGRLRDYGPWYTLTVPKSKKQGGKYYQDPDVLRLVDNGFFYEHNGQFRADVHVSNLEDLLNVLSNLGVRVKEKKEEEVEDREQVSHRLRDSEAPKKTGKGYKVFVLKDGQLYPPMVANPNGEATPVGVWLDADAAPVAGQSKTGRPQVKAGGKGTQGGSGQLAYRPGWHLGEIPYALQFNRKNENGERELFPKNFVWAEVEYADDVDYQKEAEAEGMTENGKYNHALAGLKRVPEDGSYHYRTNPDPNTDPWIITGAMKVKRILTPSEVDEMVRAAGREPQKRQEGAVTDEQVRELNQQLGLQVNPEELEKYLQDLVQQEGLKGTAMVQVINSREDIEKLKGKIMDITYDAILEDYNDPETSASYFYKADMVVLFSERIPSMKKAEETYAHEQAHHAWAVVDLTPSEKREIEEAALDYLKKNDHKRFLQVINEYDATEQSNEAIAYFVESLVSKYGFRKFMAEDLVDDKIMSTLAAQIRNILQNGTAGMVSSPRNDSGGSDKGRRESNQGSGTGETEAGSDNGDSSHERVAHKKLSEEEQVGAGAFEDDNAPDVPTMEGAIGSNVAQVAYEHAVRRWQTRVKEISQDQWQSVLEGIRAIEKETKSKIFDFENPYYAAESASASSANIREMLERGPGKTFVEEISNAAKAMGARYDEVETYAYAKHGLERNRVLAFRDVIDGMRKSYEAATGKSANDIYWGYMNDPQRTALLDNLERERRRYLRGDITLDEYWQAYQDYMAADDKLRMQYLDAASEELPVKYNAGEAYKKNREEDYSGISSLTIRLTKDSADKSEKVEGGETNTVAAPNLADTERDAFEHVAEMEKRAIDYREKAPWYKKTNFAIAFGYDVDRLWKAIRAVSDFGLRQNYEGGLISKETYDYVSSMFQYYVPLQGFADTTAEDIYAYSNEGSQSPSGILKRAGGRKSEARHTLATLYAQTDNAISFSRRNLMKQSLLRLAEDHPNSLLTVSRAWFVLNANDEPELVDLASLAGVNDGDSPEMIRQKYAAAEATLRKKQEEEPDKYFISGDGRLNIPYRIKKSYIGKHQVLVKRDGVDYIVTVNGNPRMAEAINGELSESDNSVIRQAFRTVAALQTSLNPNFVVPNLRRDLNFAWITSFIREGADYQKKFTVNASRETAMMFGRIRRYLQGTLNPQDPFDLAFETFMKEGGETSFRKSLQLENYVSDFERASKLAREGKNPADYAGYAWGLVAGGVDFLARWSELITRFSTYLTSREVGRSVQRSIHDAKEVSANFNRKGSGEVLPEKSDNVWLSLLSWFIARGQNYIPFFNAGVQGLAATMDAVYGGVDRNKGSKGRAAGVATLIALNGFIIVPLLNGLLHAIAGGGGGGDDDKKGGEEETFASKFKQGIDRYYEHPYWDRENNLLIGDVKLPYSPEVRAIHGTGDIAGEWLWRHQTGRYTNSGRMTYRLLKQMGEMMPVNLAEGATPLWPIFLSANIQAYLNENWTGRKLYRDRYGDESIPGYELAYDQEAYWTRLAKALNEATKKENKSRGAIDINPAAWEHVIRSTLGGAYQIPSQLITLGRKATGDEPFKETVEARDWPIISRFYSKTDGKEHQRVIDEEFYDLKDDMDEFEHELKKAEKSGDAAKYNRLKESDMNKDYDAFHYAENEIQKARSNGDRDLEYSLKELLLFTIRENNLAARNFKPKEEKVQK